MADSPPPARSELDCRVSRILCDSSNVLNPGLRKVEFVLGRPFLGYECSAKYRSAKVTCLPYILYTFL